MTPKQFLAREDHIALADVDEDALARLGLAVVPAYEVTDPGHRDAILSVMLAERGPE